MLPLKKQINFADLHGSFSEVSEYAVPGAKALKAATEEIEKFSHHFAPERSPIVAKLKDEMASGDHERSIAAASQLATIKAANEDSSHELWVFACRAVNSKIAVVRDLALKFIAEGYDFISVATEFAISTEESLGKLLGVPVKLPLDVPIQAYLQHLQGTEKSIERHRAHTGTETGNLSWGYNTFGNVKIPAEPIPAGPVPTA